MIKLITYGIEFKYQITLITHQIWCIQPLNFGSEPENSYFEWIKSLYLWIKILSLQHQIWCLNSKSWAINFIIQNKIWWK